jgi:hypothetical protein
MRQFLICQRHGDTVVIDAYGATWPPALQIPLTDESKASDQALETLIPELDSVLKIIAIGLSESFWVPLVWKAARI